MPAQVLFSRTTWRFIGADLLAGPFGDRKSQKVADIVGPLPAETVVALKRLAEVNVRRTAAAFSAVAVAYVSLPVAIGALLSEIAPEVMRDLVFSSGSVVIAVLVGLAFGPLTYFGRMGRARPLEWTLYLGSAGAMAPHAALPEKGAEPTPPKAAPG